MSYVHCHDCNWQQDDFWSWKGYNPLRFFLKNDLPWLIKPRWVGIDAYAMYQGRLGSLFSRIVTKPWVNHGKISVGPNGEPQPETVREHQQHSWYMLARAASNKAKRLVTQRWWTYRGWRHDCEKGLGGCPKCGKSLCID